MPGQVRPDISKNGDLTSVCDLDPRFFGFIYCYDFLSWTRTTAFALLEQLWHVPLGLTNLCLRFPSRLPATFLSCHHYKWDVSFNQRMDTSLASLAQWCKHRPDCVRSITKHSGDLKCWPATSWLDDVATDDAAQACMPSRLNYRHQNLVVGRVCYDAQ